MFCDDKNITIIICLIFLNQLIYPKNVLSQSSLS